MEGVVGEEPIYATNPETGESGPGEVIAIHPHTDQLLTLETNGGEIVTTEDHRYWNATDGDWQESQDLDAGDRLLTADGDEVTVEGFDWTTLHPARAYDLNIAGIDTFYVIAGHEAVLTHNCGVDELVGAAADFDADELAQFALQHAGEGDLPSTPSIEQIRGALTTEGVRLPGQNAVVFQQGSTIVIINEDIPWRSTAYVSRSGGR